MNRILIIVSDMGNTAPGKVFRNYIEYIALNFEYDLLSLNELKNDNLLFNAHPRLRKTSINTISLDIFDYFLAKKSISNLNIRNYSLVLTMMSANNYSPLYAGFIIKKQHPWIKWLNYCVDAVPPPAGWGFSVRSRRSHSKMIKKYLSIADKVYFSNPSMLRYQLKVLGDSFNGSSDVLYTIPECKDPIKCPKRANESFNLLYTGGVYQARKVDELLLAIDNLINNDIDITITFVGTNPNTIPLHNLSDRTISKILFESYTNDLNPFYTNADLLVDIDANIEGDVFISSKFFNYITSNKPILCITRNDSPVDKLIKKYEIDNVYISSHNPDNIYKCIFTAIKDKFLINQSLVTRDLSFIQDSIDLLIKDLSVESFD